MYLGRVASVSGPGRILELPKIEQVTIEDKCTEKTICEQVFKINTHRSWYTILLDRVKKNVVELHLPNLLYQQQPTDAYHGHSIIEDLNAEH